MIKTQRRLMHSLGALAGGLLGAAILPTTIASADVYEVVLDPSSTEQVTGFYGQFINTAPVVEGSVQGTGVFDYVDKTTGQTLGTFEAEESVTHVGEHHTEYLVTQDITGNPGTGSGDVPEPGSVIDFSPNGSTETVYSALTSPSGDVVTGYRVYPNGHAGNMHESYDAAHGLWNDSLGNKPIDLADHYSIVPAVTNGETLTSINGLPPLDIDVQGAQEFNLVSPDGTVVGSFDAVQANTSDFFGNYTEALLVTSDVSGTSGTAAGDVPAVGSIFNVFYYGSDDHYYIYSDLASPSGDDAISDYRIHPNGSESAIHTNFEATQALTAHSFVVPSDNYELVPTGSEVYSGVNGLPPYDVTVQGYQEFIVEDPTTHAQIGTFDADVTTAIKGDRTSEAITVINDLSGNPGTGSGDVPPVGSVFEDYTDGGRETIYSDLTSPSGDKASEYVVNAFGGVHQVHTNLDFASGLANDHFLDPIAAAGAADPSAGVPADALLDPFPHVEAALHLLANLF
jgi:hypothetical protein